MMNVVIKRVHCIGIQLFSPLISRFDFCKAANEEPEPTLNLGQVLFGDRIQKNSLYQVQRNKDQTTAYP